MIRLSLHHLETLFWISRLGTFSAAAQRLNTTQPAISSRIKELELRLDTKLFKKEGRRMMLTSRGRDIVQRCEPLLREMEGVLLSVTDGSNIAGNVRFGAGEVAALCVLPGFIASIKADFPRVSWDVDVDLTIFLREKLAAAALDLAFLVGPVDNHQWTSVPIGKPKMTWMFSPLSFAKKGRAAFQLAPVWSLSKNSYPFQLTVESMRKNNVSTSVINTCTHVKTLIEFVVSGAGIAMVPESLVKDELDAGRLAPLGLPSNSLSFEYHVVRRKDEEDVLVRTLFDRAASLTIS